MTELNIEEDNILNYSNLEKHAEFPDLVTQEELLDEKRGKERSLDLLT